MLRQNRAGASFVGRVGKAVQKADRDRLDALHGERFGEGRDPGLVERHQHPAFRVDALAHRKAQPARDQWRGQVDVDIVLLEAVFVADLDRVAKALGR